MRAVRYERYGGPERLQLVDLPTPQPRSDEVIVRVRAASLNSWDWDLLRGRPLITRLGGGLRRPRHPVLGADVAGDVVAVGAGVTEFAIGDRVHGDLSDAGWGGFAEFVAAPATALRRIPDEIEYADAAALPQAGGLALQGLRLARVAAGDHVLVNGAGGGTGTLAVQLARRAGAEVTAVDRADKLELLTGLGATRAIDLADPASAQPPDGGYDVIIELVARRRLRDYRGMLAPRGRFVIIGGRMGVIFATFAFGAVMGRDGRSYAVLAAHANEGLEELDAVVAAGEVHPVIDAVLPLAEVPEALRRIGAGDVHGKLVIDPTR